MNIEILCIGNLKETWLHDAAGEYAKRLRPYAQLSVTELKETRLPANASAADEEAVRRKEGGALLAALPLAGGGKDAHNVKSGATASLFVIALDRRGEALTSEGFAERLEALTARGKSRICFLIGGSLGLSEAALSRADQRLSFSAFTFPHQLMRVILLEQIYRAFKIQRGEPYHK
ncbi:MAG: 23S rRNA (pseudouridine(1915)-N(3))-methyltransferase RlmH [Clostridiales bacterium]|nr:23S rRNA (pseudouridine(1915)-N(3))-methyltransferase RlmH [Clostridiales bacterium]